MDRKEVGSRKRGKRHCHFSFFSTLLPAHRLEGEGKSKIPPVTIKDMSKIPLKNLPTESLQPPWEFTIVIVPMFQMKKFYDQPFPGQLSHECHHSSDICPQEALCVI